MGTGPFNFSIPNARVPVLQEDGSLTLPWRLWLQTLGPPTTDVGVLSLNGLGGTLNLVAGTNIAIAATGSTITISGAEMGGFLTAAGSPVNNALAVFNTSSSLTTMDLSGDVFTAGSTVTTFGPIASNELIANATGSTASPVATTLTALIDAAIGSTQGDILYRNATVWVALAPGTAGQLLQTGGAAANPSWTSPPPLMPSSVVASLPASPPDGLLYLATDCTLTAITGLGLAPTGGGTNKVPVYSASGGWLML